MTGIGMNKLFLKLKNTPKIFYILVYAEICELFGRFGITALLTLYLTTTFHFSDAAAFALYGSFTALSFVTPVVGGIICDRYLGRVNSIVLGSILMAIGNLLLGLNQPKQVLLWPDYSCDR